MRSIEGSRDHIYVGLISSLAIIIAFAFFFLGDQTFVHIDAIAHVNKARGLLDNLQPGLRQFGTVWLPLPHILMAPLAAIDPLWRTGAAGSIVSMICFVGTGIFLFLTGLEWTGSRIAGWVAFLLFALNPHLIYLFTTPENEPLMVLCAVGLFYYLIRWIRYESWRDFALAALFMFGGTWTRYEGWALAAMAIVVVAVMTRHNRVAATIIFAGAAVLGPMLWMLFNMVYFDDPLIFLFGAGSAQQYASQVKFATAGSWWDSASLYFMDAAYCLNPGVMWLAIGGIITGLGLTRRTRSRATVVLAGGGATIFVFYTVNLYLNIVPITMPGMLKNDPQSAMNVRYGSVMAAAIPLFAAQFVFVVFQQVQYRRAFSLALLAPLFLPDPLPSATHESMSRQFTGNLFYFEAIHNQSFWMPPFVDVARKLKSDLEDQNNDRQGLIMANTRIEHVVVWATGIPMRRFVTEMNKEYWEANIPSIGPEIRWVITEEGDQLWHAQGKFLQNNFVEVANAKTESTGRVHLFRRRE